LLKRSLLSACAAFGVLAGVLAGTPAPAATATSAAPAAPQDACASKPSQWARVKCEEYTHSAPGDEYFGRMKLSYLGINNTFHDETIRAGAYTTDSGIIAKIAFADEALQQWAQRYPGDPQLARSYYLAIQMYKKVYTRDAQQKAWTYMHLLTARFGGTYFGKLERADLARGFTEHYFANPELCPTPLPSGMGAPPAAVPSAAATPTPAPGQPKVEIIEPQCVEPASPSPSPSPLWSPSPSESPLASPSASP
jgi:hypothetical protein